MHFTQEDYKKIEQWLLKNSVKDSEFQEALLPISGEETIVIVQEGYNRKMSVKDLSDNILKLGISDFINVSEIYNVTGIGIKEAISYIPYNLRQKGLVITFCSTDNLWKIYQFTGSLEQWNNVTLWEDIFNIKKYVIDSILPDEEDLTLTDKDDNGNSYIKIKDRIYDPENFSGLGKKTLRKRITSIEDLSHTIEDKNILLQEDVTEENTIYEILYDFDLNNQTIEIPNNCILDFRGGSISNGKIILNTTKIYPNGYFDDFLKNIKIEGKFAKGQFRYSSIKGIPVWWNGLYWQDAMGEEANLEDGGLEEMTL